MSVFGNLVEPERAIFGEIVSPTSRAPGLRSGLSDDFHSGSFSNDARTRQSPEEVFADWLEYSRAIAQQALVAAERAPDSTTALARLAQAQLAAGDAEAAEITAQRVFDLALEQTGSSAGTAVDAAAVFSAGSALIALGKGEVAETRLVELPSHPTLTIMRAGLVAEANRHQEALQLLEKCDVAEASSLRGYIYLRVNEPHKALAELRNAYRTGSSSAEVCANMARAFWKLGSRRKAIRFARQASAVAPGRKDLSLLLFGFLMSAGEFDSADQEIKEILARGVAEAPELLMMQARLAFAQNSRSKAVSLLRRAAAMAKASNDGALAAEISGRVAALRQETGEITVEEALTRVRELIRDTPLNIALVGVFSELCNKVSHAQELRSLYEKIAKATDPSDRFPIEIKLAYLEGRFSDLVKIATGWSQEDPLNSSAAGLAMLYRSYLTQDWRDGACVAESLVRKFPQDCFLANNAAYIMVLGGKVQHAERLLEGREQCVQFPSYVLLATKGLIQIAKGDVQAGLGLYRRAANIAEQGRDGYVRRVLVTEYQGLTLHMLGSFDLVNDVAIRAAALPPVVLPRDWEAVPEFRFLEWACQRAGCTWPPMQM